MLKPAPDAPLPGLPPMPFTQPMAPRDPYRRRDSDVLPLPSPTTLFSGPRATIPTSSQSLGQPMILAPSPDIDQFMARPSQQNIGGRTSSPLLGPLEESEEMEVAEDDMALDG